MRRASLTLVCARSPRFWGTFVSLGALPPKPPAFAALDPWHGERPGCAPRLERLSQVHEIRRCGGQGSVGKHAERRGNRRVGLAPPSSLRWGKPHPTVAGVKRKMPGVRGRRPRSFVAVDPKVRESRMSRFLHVFYTPFSFRRRLVVLHSIYKTGPGLCVIVYRATQSICCPQRMEVRRCNRQRQSQS